MREFPHGRRVYPPWRSCTPGWCQEEFQTTCNYSAKYGSTHTSRVRAPQLLRRPSASVSPTASENLRDSSIDTVPRCGRSTRRRRFLLLDDEGTSSPLTLSILAKILLSNAHERISCALSTRSNHYFAAADGEDAGGTSRGFSASPNEQMKRTMQQGATVLVET